MSTKARTPRLGRGLSSLMGQPVRLVPSTPAPTATAVPSGVVRDSPSSDGQVQQVVATSSPPNPQASRVATSTEPNLATGLRQLAVGAITPNRYQPRQRFDPASLQQLADSIQSAGMMQPIIVRPLAQADPGQDGPAYELVAGERRWRAAQLAGLDQVPAIVRELDDRQVAEWALIENLQREDLNPIERAQAFKQLAEQFKLSHDQIAQQVGVDRSTISNALRLLALHADVQKLVREGAISGGQAKAIAGVVNPQQQLLLAQRAIRGDWSVRQLEQAVRSASPSASDQDGESGSGSDASGGAINVAGHTRQGRAAHLQDLEAHLGQQLQTKVRLRTGRKKGSGTLMIDFYDLDQFDNLLTRLNISAE
ncbi:MAG: ParB/RepB/Spo0J family partition protein [Phycisphaeraceae bacterium]